MKNRFIMPKQINISRGVLFESKEDISKLGRRALIVTGKVMESIGNVKLLTDILDEISIEYKVFAEIVGEPTDVMVIEGVEVYKRENCDFLIGIGGGSSLDAMKAIAALITNSGNIVDYYGKRFSNSVPPMVAIPTTAGTGSEATEFSIITDTKTNIKMLLQGIVLIPELVVIDPLLTLTASPSVTASTGLDALTHAIEAYTSKKAQPLSDTFAISAVKRIFEYLPIVFRNGDDINAREEMSIAALEAGIAFNNSSVTLVHGMSRPLGAIFHIAHGTSNAMLLNVCLSFALDGCYERFGMLGRAIGVAKEDDSDPKSAEAFLVEVSKICKECRIPTLREYGIEKIDFFDVIEKMAADAIESTSPANTAKTITKEDIVSMYKKLWE